MDELLRQLLLIEGDDHTITLIVIAGIIAGRDRIYQGVRGVLGISQPDFEELIRQDLIDPVPGHPKQYSLTRKARAWLANS